MVPTLSTVIKNIYNNTNDIISGIYQDDDWSNAWKVINKIHSIVNSFNLLYGNQYLFEMGQCGYKSNPNTLEQWKEYKFIIKDEKHNDVRYGVLNCCAAGTIEDPFLRYDMCLMF
jgi:hypothetical protein